jgi:16S rRNA (guanine1207-N2)-methyltransferase
MERREYRVTLDGREFRFETQPGVFSAGGADAGTMLLVESLLPAVRPHQKVLDLGAGAGLIGITIAPKLTRGEVWMVDVDIRATRLAARNVAINGIENAHVILGDVTADLPQGLRFDTVASNPPTHDGREVLQQFVDQSYRVLRPGGSLWCVANRLLSLQDMMSTCFGEVEVIARRKGFVVLRSRKARRAPHPARNSSPSADEP